LFIQRVEYGQKLIIGFSARSASRPTTSTHVSSHGSETLLPAGRAFGGGASMLGKDAKIGMMKCDSVGCQLTFLTFEFWYCWTNSLCIRLIQLLKLWVFPTQLS
jgi:hypothetical protein